MNVIIEIRRPRIRDAVEAPGTRISPDPDNPRIMLEMIIERTNEASVSKRDQVCSNFKKCVFHCPKMSLFQLQRLRLR
jgi:hypothetical protein